MHRERMEMGREGSGGYGEREQHPHATHREGGAGTTRERGASTLEEDSKSLRAVSSSFSNEGKSLKSDERRQAEAAAAASRAAQSYAAASVAQANGAAAGIGSKQSPGVVTHNGSEG